ncbi:hypothetical protein SE18_01630 [Herpetosiphon geysericola]|uniref:Uncharacterized protein n=1 Tax=Herpetosiphon geysericola TaxID=70996 RepID=A0A0P6Y5U2_9CHLR|nr:hypothetical protein SE18_01630 [Herpetosiphon geysericola]
MRVEDQGSGASCQEAGKQERNREGRQGREGTLRIRDQGPFFRNQENGNREAHEEHEGEKALGYRKIIGVGNRGWLSTGY